MSKVAIVTDSTANIPEAMLRGLPLHVLPLHVIWGENNYADGIDITPTEFYTRLQTAKTMPTTSQVTPGAFRDLYSRLLEEGYEILSLHISAKLSGTLDSAQQAMQYFPGAKINLVDSESTSMALGFLTLAVARAAQQGATLAECTELARHARTNINVYFVPSTLEFLHRGGRIGGAAALVGTALNLKPILSLRDGRVEAIERVRTMGKALDRMMEHVSASIDGRRPVRLAAIHANSPDEAAQLLERARQNFSVSEVSDALCAEVSPVIGTHTGPGTVGLAFMTGL